MRDQRKAQGITQIEAGQRVGMKQSTLSSFENNPGNTKLDTLFRILSSTNLELHIKSRNADKQTKSGDDIEW